MSQAAELLLLSLQVSVHGVSRHTHGCAWVCVTFEVHRFELQKGRRRA
jgi:hypothetical protein